MTHHVLFLGHDNESKLELHADGQNLSADQYDAITRVQIDLQLAAGAGSLTMDSAVTPGLFEWSGELRLVVIEGARLGDVPVPAGKHKGRVIAYSPDQPTGVVFADFREYVLEVRT